MENEKRLIDADAALKKVCEDCCCDFEECKQVGFCVDYTNIEQLPTINAVEVVHAEWSIAERNKSARTVLVECCNCNAMFELPMFTFGFNYNYCPNCGAKMDGGNEDG